MIDRKFIGLALPEFSAQVEAGALRFFAKAIGQTDPIYVDEAAAREVAVIFRIVGDQPCRQARQVARGRVLLVVRQARSVAEHGVGINRHDWLKMVNTDLLKSSLAT